MERKRGETETRCKARRPKVQREWVIKMVGLYKQEQPSPLGWGVEGGTPTRRAPETGRDQGCRESMAARSA